MTMLAILVMISALAGVAVSASLHLSAAISAVVICSLTTVSVITWLIVYNHNNRR